LKSNHYHLCVKTPKSNLARCIRHINSNYTQRDERLKKEWPVVTRQIQGNIGGGWWMICPDSGRRARKLYLFPGLDRFVHSKAACPRPTCAIQRTSGLDTIIHQRSVIRRKIDGDVSTLLKSLRKPKGMHGATFRKYQQRDDRLAQIEFGILSRFIASFS
jgi:hypothetical protein